MNDMPQITHDHSLTSSAEFHATPDASKQDQQPSADQLRRKHLRRKHLITLELVLSVVLSIVAIGLVYEAGGQERRAESLPDTLSPKLTESWPSNTATALVKDAHMDGARLVAEREVAVDTIRNTAFDASTESDSPRESPTDQEQAQTSRPSDRGTSEQPIGPATIAMAEQRIVVTSSGSIPQMAAVSLTAVAFVLLWVGVRLAAHDKRRSC
jgi:hypothetical protein